MMIVRWHELTYARFRPRSTSLTVGVFDGLHAGHRALISRVTNASTDLSAVVTFARHPAEVLGDHRFPGYLQTPDQKHNDLEALGVDVVVEIDFSQEFSQTPGEQFLSRLVEAFDLRLVVIGHDFRCGRQLDTDTDAIQRFFASRGVIAEVAAPVELDGQRVSSTRIRALVSAGQIDSAAKLLGRPYVLDLSRESLVRDRVTGMTVVRTETTGIARILPIGRQLVPGPGLYDGIVPGRDHEPPIRVEVDANSVRWPLSAGDPILYIVLKNRRIEDKE